MSEEPGKSEKFLKNSRARRVLTPGATFGTFDRFVSNRGYLITAKNVAEANCADWGFRGRYVRGFRKTSGFRQQPGFLAALIMRTNERTCAHEHGVNCA